MNCFEIVLFVFLSAFVPSLTTVGAIDYEIPEACPADTTFPLNGATMAGSTLIYKNSQNLKVTFYVNLDKFNNPDATVSVHTDSGTTVHKENFQVTADKKPINFSLTGGWSGTDIGNVLYKSVDGGTEDCYHRAATNLLVGASYDVADMKDKQLTIQARENCGVQVVLGGVSGNRPSGCSTKLEFATGGEIDASFFGNEVTTAKRPISFRISSGCTSGKMYLYYREKCPSTTNGTLHCTDSSQPMSSGVNVVLCSLLITTILTSRMLQW